MRNRLFILVASLLISVSMLAQNKINDRLGESAEVLRQILSKPDDVPAALLHRSVCIVVFPAVKKVGVGLGVTYGRGALVCRSGADMTGPWAAPAMYKLDVGTLGVQLGGSTTDYVLLVESKQGATKVLSGKQKLGADASAVAGPTGAKAVGANDVHADILTYSRAKSGLFAGASLGSASIEIDDDANMAVYGKAMTANAIVRDGAVQPTDAGKALMKVATQFSPKYQ